MKESNFIYKRFASERGAGLIDYTILVCIVCITSLAAVRVFGTSLSESYMDIVAELEAGGADVN